MAEDHAVRTAETPIVSTVHHPFGSPAGPGLFHVKGLQLPAYLGASRTLLTHSGVRACRRANRSPGLLAS